VGLTTCLSLVVPAATAWPRASWRDSVLVHALCVSFEKDPAVDRTGSAGWYNNLAFDRLAAADNLCARSLSADAFADVTKGQVADIGAVILVASISLYIASLRRSEPTRPRASSIAAHSSPWAARSIRKH
jgi:enoyl-[acyl-carrier protein] reductase/trans-2-enoyl-CoA reductase (NAD+)